MRIKAIVAITLLLVMCGMDSVAQSYIDKKVKQPSYQNNKVGGGFSNYFKRLELEFGGSMITSTYTFWREGIDENDNTYKILPESVEKEQRGLFHGGINTYFPLSQPTLHSVYGLGLNAYVEFTDFYQRGDLRMTNISVPLMFYSKFGADASFDSRTRFSWGWGLGYVPSLFRLDATRSTVVGYPLVYVEGGIFASSSIKVRISSNLGYRYRVDEVVDGLNTTPRSWQTSEYKVFPFRASLVWTPASFGWERNKWKN